MLSSSAVQRVVFQRTSVIACFSAAIIAFLHQPLANPPRARERDLLHHVAGEEIALRPAFDDGYGGSHLDLERHSSSSRTLFWMMMPAGVRIVSQPRAESHRRRVSTSSRSR